MVFRNVLLYALPWLTVCTALAQEVPTAESYLARAGNVFISEKEFLERFELTPGLYRHRKGKLDEEKLAVLYSLIAEKLLAQEAQARNFDRDSLYQDNLLEMTKLLARDELYRREVSEKVKITDKEIEKGMQRALRQVHIRFMFFPGEDAARFIRSRMARSEDFERIQLDSSMGAIRDTATVIWGDADTTIEEAAYALKNSGISPVLKAGDGYYVLKVDRSSINSWYSGMTPDVLRERVATMLRRRKERVRVEEYVHNAIADRPGYAPPERFKWFSQNVIEAFRHHPQAGPSAVTPAIMHELTDNCHAKLNDTLIVAGIKMWTVGEVIQRLYVKGFTINGDPEKVVTGRLFASVKEWVQQELLAQEAVRRGLDRAPEVQRQLEQWRDAGLAAVMKEKIGDRVTVSDHDAYAFLASQDTTAAEVPLVQIREIRTASMENMTEALGDLQRGISFEEVVRRWTTDPVVRERKGISDFFSAADRPPVGDIAAQLEVGQRFGPVRDSTGVVYFELLAKKLPSPSADSSLAKRLSQAKATLRLQKQKRMVTLFLAQVAKQRGVDVYSDRLLKMNVSAVPMLAFRLLGFGGRMFAVPFVDRQLDWLDVEPPQGTIFP